MLFPEHQQASGAAYIELLHNLHKNAYRCLRELVLDLHNLLRARASGVAWFWRDGRVTVCFASPSDDVLTSALQAASVRARVRTAFSSPAGEAVREWIEIEGGESHSFLHLCAFRIPAIYGPDTEDGHGAVCIIDPLLRDPPDSAGAGLSLEPVVAVLEFWGAKISCHRSDLVQTSRSARGAVAAGTLLDGWSRAIGASARHLHRMMGLTELVQVANLAASMERTVDSESQWLIDILGPGFSEWHHCAPPHWPPCCQGKCAPISLAASLMYWSRWRDEVPAERIRQRIVDAREKALTDPGGFLADDRKALRELSREALTCSKPENLLPKGLQAFVVGRMLDRLQDPEVPYWAPGAVSDSDVAGALSSVAKTAHYVLGDLPLDDSTIQSMIWMLSDYAHGILGIPGRIDLRAHLLQAARGEPALHALKSYYRDHFFHALEVCFLGHFLLELECREGRFLWQWVAEQMGLQGDDAHDSVLRLWYLAALLHDVGYGIDILTGVRSLLKFFQNAEPMKRLVNDLQGALDRLSTELGAERFAGYSVKHKPGEDHGVVAARHLQALLDTIAETDPSIKPADYLPAVRAIALHNSHRQTVSFRRDPLAFLLIICDTIQEWNRPRLKFNTAPMRLLAHLTDGETDAAHWRGPLQRLTMNVKRTSRRFRLQGLKHSNAVPSGSCEPKLRIELEYGKDIQPNAGVFNLWLDASCSLQRLDFDGLPPGFDIEIVYITPQFHPPGVPQSQVEQQFYRLRDAAREAHMSFLEKWFPTERPPANRGEIGEVTNGAVTYGLYSRSDPQKPKERLTLNLRELSKTKRITKDINHFRECLKRWQNYNQDREFPGDYGAPESVE